MSVPVILAIGGVALVLMLVWRPLAAKLALDDLKANCAALKAQLAIHQTQGGDVAEAARLEVQIATCNAALAEAGVAIDSFTEDLAIIYQVRNQMRQEFTHYKSTDWADLVKRGNTRGTVLRLGEELAQRYEAALGEAETIEAEALLLREVRIDINDSLARSTCWRLGSAGCGKNPGNMVDEKDRVTTPLKSAEAAIVGSLAALRRAAITPEQAAAREARLGEQETAREELGDIFRRIGEFQRNK